ncbi:hypothetical protein COBT_003166 [Conglomerata obtusa]
MITCILAANLQISQQGLYTITGVGNTDIYLPSNYGEKILLDKQYETSTYLPRKNRIKNFETSIKKNRKKRQTTTIPNTDQFVEEVISPQSFFDIEDMREAIEVKDYKYEDINYATYLYKMINKVIPFMSNLNIYQIMQPDESEHAEIHNCIALIRLRGQIALKEDEKDNLLKEQIELTKKLENADEDEKTRLAYQIGNMNIRLKNKYDSLQKLRSEYNKYGLKQRAFKNKTV